MTDLKTEKGTLYAAILHYVDARAKDGWDAVAEAGSATHAIEGAITVLDNAAYDRGYEQARVWQAGYRTEEIARLKQELDQAERRRTREASEADQLLKERDAARAESIKLLAALGRIEVLTRRGMNDDDLLPVVKRAQAEAWKAYRDAQGAVLPIGEDMPEAVDEEKGNPRLLRQIVSALVQRESKLEKALETLADRYHAQMCYRCRRTGGRRQTCSQPPLAVQDAERALLLASRRHRTSPARLTMLSWWIGRYHRKR